MTKSRPQAHKSGSGGHENVTPHWVTTRAAADFFQIGNTKVLLEARAKGLFRLGEHYLDLSDPNAARPSYRWSIAALERAWSIPPEHREPA